MPSPARALVAALASASLVALSDGAWYDSLLADLTVPPGFSLEVYAEVPAARSLSVSSITGTVFVGAYDFSGIQGRDAQLAVYALRDLDANNNALAPGEALPVTQKISSPCGVSVLNGDLFVAQMHRIDKYAAVETDIETLKTPVTVVDSEPFPFPDGTGLPETGWHGWRYLTANEATNKLYVTIGSPCNVPGDGEVLDCNDTVAHPLLGTITEFNADGSGLRAVAHGIRNTLGVAFHPTTGDMWFTDNGRDQWGGVWTEHKHLQPTVHTEAECEAARTANCQAKGLPDSWCVGAWDPASSSPISNCTTSTFNLNGGAGTDEMPPGELNRIP